MLKNINITILYCALKTNNLPMRSAIPSDPKKDHRNHQTSFENFSGKFMFNVLNLFTYCTGFFLSFL